MVGGLSGMAVNCQVTSLAAAPRTVAAPASLMTKRRSSVPLALLLCAPEAGSASPPPRDHVEVISGPAAARRAPRRHREGGGGLYRLARPQARQDHRRAPGIGRRAHPSIDAEVGRHHHALPIERSGDTLHPF